MNYIKVYDNVVTPEHCKQIIEQFDKGAWPSERIDTDGYGFTQAYINDGFGNVVVNNFKQYYEDYFRSFNVDAFVAPDQNIEMCRIKKYDKGTDDQFKMHVDVVNHATATRYAIALLYLNDNDGKTEFPNQGISVEPKAGRLVIFPPFWTHPHAGLAPKNDDKYILMTSLHYA